MKVQLLSDIHLESGPFTLVDKGADVICICGDVAEAQARGRIAGMLSTLTREVPIVVIMGNHDYLGHHEERLRNSSVDLFGYRFLGTSLWTGWNAYGTKNVAKVGALRAQIPDFYQSLTGGRFVQPDDYEEWYKEAKEWLQDEIKASSTPCVVMTHFLPSTMSVSERYQGQLLNAYFVGEASDLLGPKVPLWMHGHTHDKADYVQHGTRVVCNPVGYRGERGREYDKNLIIEV